MEAAIDCLHPICYKYLVLCYMPHSVHDYLFKEKKKEVLRDLRQLQILDRGMQIPENTDDISKPACILYLMIGMWMVSYVHTNLLPKVLYPRPRPEGIGEGRQAWRIHTGCLVSGLHRV